MTSNSAQFKCTSETGVQLLERLFPRPKLNGLDQTLFDNGPNPNDVIEIAGDISCGKTLTITNLIAKCILPKRWCDIDIGGLDVGVIFLDTDHHFEVIELIHVMEAFITGPESTSGLHIIEDTDRVEAIIKDSFKNLIILHCYDSIQLTITLHGIEIILSKHKHISLVILDSISAFYWPDRYGKKGVYRMDLYLKEVLLSVLKHVQQYKVSFIYTRPSTFVSKLTGKKYKDNIDDILTRKIYLQRIFDRKKVMYNAHISSSSESKTIPYKINGKIIKWNSS